MNHHVDKPLRPAVRGRRMRTLLVLVAGLSMASAWSSQLAGGNIGRVSTETAPTRPGAAPSSSAPKVLPQRPSRAASGAARAASSGTR